MARKTTITKEMILDAALTMLIRDGYASVNIKTIAKELGCSTQPIAWHFENMEGLRRELRRHAGEYARAKSSGGQKADLLSAENAADTFEKMGRSYIRMALKEPNLFRFLYLGEGPISSPYTFQKISEGKEEQAMIEGIAAQTGLTKEQAVRCIQNTVIYSHGLATMVATGVYKASEKELMKMVHDASSSFVRMEMQAMPVNKERLEK